MIDQRAQQPAAQSLSPRARALGFSSINDVRRECAASREGWGGSAWCPPGPLGLEYHCALCGRDFTSRSGALKHERTHPLGVLRTDWYRDDYLAWVGAYQRRREARR